MALPAPPTQGHNLDTWGDDYKAFHDISYGRSLASYGAQGDNFTNDTAAVQAWLNDNSSGAIAVVPPGTYLVDNLTVPLGIPSIFAPSGATFKRRATGPLLTVNNPGIVIDGIHLDGQGASFTGGSVLAVGSTITDVTVTNCWLEGASTAFPYVIQTSGTANRLTVSNCLVNGGILVQQSDAALIDGNRFFAASVATAGFGANIQSTNPAGGQHADSARIVNNYYEIPAGQFAIVPAMRNASQRPRGVIIANNTMIAVGNCLGGISVDTSNDCTVAGNSFWVSSGTPSTGALEVAQSNNVTVTGNDFDGGGVMDTLISVNNSSDGTIAGNTLRAPSTVGNTKFLLRFIANSAAQHCSRNIVSGNKFVNLSGGNGMIGLGPGGNATALFDENLIVGNSFYGNASSRGISLDGTIAAGSILRTSILNNHFTTLSQGIRFFQDDQTVVSGNRFASDVTTRFSQGGSTTNIHVENNDFQLATVVPASQSHFAGERVYNSAPTVGQPVGWVCTVTGTPGTWVALPNL